MTTPKKVRVVLANAVTCQITEHFIEPTVAALTALVPDEFANQRATSAIEVSANASEARKLGKTPMSVFADREYSGKEVSKIIGGGKLWPDRPATLVTYAIDVDDVVRADEGPQYGFVNFAIFCGDCDPDTGTILTDLSTPMTAIDEMVCFELQPTIANVLKLPVDCVDKKCQEWFESEILLGIKALRSGFDSVTAMLTAEVDALRAKAGSDPSDADLKDALEMLKRAASIRSTREGLLRLTEFAMVASPKLLEQLKEKFQSAAKNLSVPYLDAVALFALSTEGDRGKATKNLTEAGVPAAEIFDRIAKAPDTLN